MCSERHAEMLANWHTTTRHDEARALTSAGGSLLRVTSRAPATATEVASPPDLGEAIRALRAKPILSEQYKAHVRSVPAPVSESEARTAASTEAVAPPPSLTEAIQKRRHTT
jgi:hypothetical protein